MWQIKQTYVQTKASQANHAFFMYISNAKYLCVLKTLYIDIFHVYICTCTTNLCKICSALQIRFNPMSQALKKQLCWSLRVSSQNN